MPIITLTMSWISYGARPSPHGGWRFELCEGSEPVDMSSLHFVRGKAAPYVPRANNWTRMGPDVWLLTSLQEQLFMLTTREDTAAVDFPPMTFATRILDFLLGKGYHVVASHSKGWGDHPFSDGVTMDVWTLEKR